MNLGTSDASPSWARLFALDSDGDINPILPALMEGRVNVVYPMEPAAGMDIVQVRERYGTRLAMIGGIDKHVLRQSREEIVAELEYKIPPLVRTGGCMLGLDHRIPNGTPLEHYRFYVEKAWEIMEREAADLRQARKPGRPPEANLRTPDAARKPTTGCLRRFERAVPLTAGPALHRRG